MFKGRRNLASACAAVVAAQCFVALTICVIRVPAQQLALRRYSMAEGLAHSRITYIYQDRKGYMWFATWEGLSRFDGYQFTNYGMRDGIVNPLVNAIAEDRQGRFWITTHIGGLARLVDEPWPARAQADKFVSYSVGDTPGSYSINTLLFDSNDRVWCGTSIGLYRGSWDEAGDLRFEAVVPGEAMTWPQQSLIDARGHLWFASNNEVIRVIDNRVTKYLLPDVPGHRDIVAILEQRPGSLLVAHSSGIQEFLMPAGGEGQGEWRRFPLTLLQGQTISSLTIDSKGVMWVGTTKGLIKLGNGSHTLYTTAQGLSQAPRACRI
jgi:ligand-binding sensor domain-containing protein